MILGKSIRPKYCLAIGSMSVKESDQWESLELIIDKHNALRIYVRTRIISYMLLGVKEYI